MPGLLHLHSGWRVYVACSPHVAPGIMCFLFFLLLRYHCGPSRTLSPGSLLLLEATPRWQSPTQMATTDCAFEPGSKVLIERSLDVCFAVRQLYLH